MQITHNKNILIIMIRFDSIQYFNCRCITNYRLVKRSLLMFHNCQCFSAQCLNILKLVIFNGIKIAGDTTGIVKHITNCGTRDSNYYVGQDQCIAKRGFTNNNPDTVISIVVGDCFANNPSKSISFHRDINYSVLYHYALMLF